MHKKLFSRLICGVIGITVITLPLVASAHEHDTFMIGDKVYEIKIGSLGEPLLVDDKSGVDLTVTTPNGKAVTGLEKDLKVELRAGDKKKVLDLQPTDTDGVYAAPFIPTVQTMISYRLFGKLNNVPVSLTFTCQPTGSFDEMAVTGTAMKISDKVVEQQKVGGFGCPEVRADYGFPENAMIAAELNHKIAQAKSEALASADARATEAKTYGIVGIAFGILGFVMGAVVLTKRRKS